MNRIDGMLFALVGILAVVAFLNHGKLTAGAEPSGVSFGFGYGTR